MSGKRGNYKIDLGDGSRNSKVSQQPPNQVEEQMNSFSQASVTAIKRAIAQIVTENLILLSLQLFLSLAL